MRQSIYRSRSCPQSGLRSFCCQLFSIRHIFHRRNVFDEWGFHACFARGCINLPRGCAMADGAIAIDRYPLADVFMTMLLQPLDFARKVNRLQTLDLSFRLGALLWQNPSLLQLTQDAGALSKQVPWNESAIFIDNYTISILLHGFNHHLLFESNPASA